MRGLDDHKGGPHTKSLKWKPVHLLGLLDLSMVLPKQNFSSMFQLEDDAHGLLFFSLCL